MTMYKVVAYGRVSTNKEEQQALFKSQKLMFENYVKQQGWTLAELYIDESNGARLKRTQLIEDIKNQDTKNKVIEVLIIQDLSRLVRNGELLYEIKKLLKEKGVNLISLDGAINTMEFSLDRFGLLGRVYEKELKNLPKISGR
ncbi:recombinase family protein [Bacillus zanthoxyli]|nr:recombinase family protein [Bacillus zanthoxyli]